MSNLPDNTSEEIYEILFPIYNYGWPGTGMPGTQKQMPLNEAKQAINNLIAQRENAARIDECLNILRSEAPHDATVDSDFVRERMEAARERIAELSLKPLEDQV